MMIVMLPLLLVMMEDNHFQFDEISCKTSNSVKFEEKYKNLIQENSLENVIYKMAAMLFEPQCKQGSFCACTQPMSDDVKM